MHLKQTSSAKLNKGIGNRWAPFLSKLIRGENYYPILIDRGAITGMLTVNRMVHLNNIVKCY